MKINFKSLEKRQQLLLLYINKRHCGTEIDDRAVVLAELSNSVALSEYTDHPQRPTKTK